MGSYGQEQTLDPFGPLGQDQPFGSSCVRLGTEQIDAEHQSGLEIHEPPDFQLLVRDANRSMLVTCEGIIGNL